jgi:hypothetical protein
MEDQTDILIRIESHTTMDQWITETTLGNNAFSLV